MNAISDSACASGAAPSFSAQFGAPQDARNFGDVLVWPAGGENENHFVFVPLQVSLVQNAADMPNLGLYDAGGMGFFYATASWQITPERMELLRRELTAPEGIAPHLSYAPATVTAAQVITCDHDGAETIIHEQTPSPHPPFTAMLQFSTDATARTPIMAALGGAPHRLLLRYQIVRQVPRTTTYTLHGLFPQDSTPDSLGDALARGDLTITPLPDTDALRAAILQQAGIARILPSTSASETVVTVTLSVPTTHPFTITVDIGRTMAAHLPLHDPLPPVSV